MEKKLKDLVDKALSRRSFLAGAGTVAAGTLIAGCSNSTPATTTPATTTPATTTPAALTDVDYLNFALNLEYLEAEYYLHCATGTGLSSADAGSGAAAVVVPSGATQLTGLTTLQAEYLNEIAQNELDHVRFLRSALGSSAVPRPAIDLTFFGPLATAAGITTTNSFSPFASYGTYLIGAFIFEDVGVTAYHGAALLLTSKTNLTAGAEIHAVEAYHAASIRSQIVAIDALTTPSPGLTGIANKVSMLRGSLGGGMETALSSTSIVAAATGTSIGFKRNTDQVLHIVYGAAGGAGLTKGGFFPAGMNGRISATLS